MPAMWRLLGAALALCRLAAAFDQSKFRTCEQGSFCRRYKKYVAKVEGSGGTLFAHGLDPQTLRHQGHALSAKVVHVNDGGVKPLLLDLRFFRDAVEGRCGIVRVTLAEESPLHRRFQLRAGDVVLEESALVPDAVELSDAGNGSTRLASTALGGCAVTVRHRPFELVFEAGGHVLQRFNGRHLLNFERYREKNSPAPAGLVDATSEDTKDLWEEGFAGHHDAKPRGPAAVGVDVSFESAATLVGSASHATQFDMGAPKFQEPYRFYNLDVFEYALDIPAALYGAIPFVTAVHRWAGGGSTASGLFIPNPSEGFVKVDSPAKSWFPGGSAAEPTKTWWLFESGVLDAFLFAGPSPHAVLEQYHTVTGWPRMPPIAALGKHQSRWNYVDVEDSLGVNKKFDQHDIPYDVLWLDIDHTDGKKYFTWHPTHFRNPEKLLDALAESKRKLVTIVDPHIKRENGYPVFEQIKSADLFTKTKSMTQYDGWCWPGTSFYPDFCNPAMRDKWATFFKPDFYPESRRDLYTWNDMNEPSVFNGPEVSMPRDNRHKCHWDDWEVEHRDVHNVYGYYHHGATVQGQLERAPDVRPFVLTRSFFAGSHRHGAMWTGDNMAKWTHLQKSVPMLLSLCVCGMSFGGADVPGFFFDPEPELFRRWHQLGIWYPFYRGHAHLETKRREPWTQGDETTAMIRDQVTARYQLMPTWYTLFAEWSMRGLPILRPTWWHNLDDAKSFDYVDNQYLVGESILVRAVTEAGQKVADTYFPPGQWVDFWDAKAAPKAGGKAERLSLDQQHVPAFVKMGHIVFKRMRRRRSTGAMAADPYTIYVYGSPSKGRIYIDDGESHAFQAGRFVYEELDFDGTSLRERPAGGFLANSASQGLGEDMSEKSLRVERVVFVGLAAAPSGARVVQASGQTDEAQVTAEKTAAGTWVATVKKPTCLLGSLWSLELAY